MTGSRFQRAAVRFYLLFVVLGLVAVFLGLNALVIGALASFLAALGVPATDGPAAFLPGLVPNLGLALLGYGLLRGGLFFVFGTIRHNFMRF